MPIDTTKQDKRSKESTLTCPNCKNRKDFIADALMYCRIEIENMEFRSVDTTETTPAFVINDNHTVHCSNCGLTTAAALFIPTTSLEQVLHAIWEKTDYSKSREKKYYCVIDADKLVSKPGSPSPTTKQKSHAFLFDNTSDAEAVGKRFFPSKHTLARLSSEK